MSEQNDLTNLHVQRKLRPKFEDVIPIMVSEDNQQNALDFAVWLRENKMSPGWGGIHNHWNINYKGRVLCKIGANKRNDWWFSLYLANIERYEDIILSENLQNFIWDRVIFCVWASRMERPADAPEIKHVASMGTNCKRARCAITVTICGKEFQYKCGNGTFRSYGSINPNKAEIAAIKRLIQLEKQARYEIYKETGSYAPLLHP